MKTLIDIEKVRLGDKYRMFDRLRRNKAKKTTIRKPSEEEINPLRHLIEKANKSPKMIETLKTIVNKYGENNTKKLAGPMLYAIGRCFLGSTLDPIGFVEPTIIGLVGIDLSDADVDFVRFSYSCSCLSGDLLDNYYLAEIYPNRKIRFRPSEIKKFKRSFNLNNSEIAIIKDAIKRFFGVGEG